MFYKLKQGVFASSSESADVTEVVVPLATAANLAGIEMPERDAEVVEKDRYHKRSARENVRKNH